MRKFIAVALAALMLTQTAAVSEDLSALPLGERFRKDTAFVAREAGFAYITYAQQQKIYAENAYKAYSGDDVAATPMHTQEGYTIGGAEKPALVWKEAEGEYSWEVEAPADGLYNISITYGGINDFGATAVRSLMIDGETPFNEAGNIPFLWRWNDAAPPTKNNVGDDVVPMQKLLPMWITEKVRDSEGAYAMPLEFYLAKGKHTISLGYIDQPIAIADICLTAPALTPTYSEYVAAHSASEYGGDPIVVEAESNVLYKNDSTLRLISNDDPKSSPYTPGYKRLNTIGDYYFRTGGQTIAWTINVPKDGLYKLGMRLGQWYNNGLPVFRQFRIDGEVPFAELSAYKFTYDKEWRMEYLQDDAGSPYMLYLTEGEHTLSMTVTLGEYGNLSQELLQDSLDISNTLLSITMITGPNPDVNYEYDFERRIPNLVETLEGIAESIKEKVDRITNIAGKQTQAASSLAQSYQQIQSLAKDPEAIARRINDLSSAQSNLSNWYISLKEQPLSLDYFTLSDNGYKRTGIKSNFVDRTVATFRNFITSFYKDYDSIGNVYTEEGAETPVVLRVWTTSGTERAEVLKQLADESFSKKTGIYININVIPADQMNAGTTNALMLSIVSGRAPDVALGVGANSPTEFAFRNAAVDVSQFADFPQMRGQFNASTFVPLTFRDKVYGVPETMDMRVLFYRKDVLEEIGLTPPDTWDEFLESTLPILYQNKMSFYLPNDFSTFLFQHGGQYYSDDGMRSALDSANAYTAFKHLVEMYTSYGLDYTKNFFPRFRIGDMPMGIGGFGDYMQISIAAPELVGRWGITQIPATVTNGVKNRAYSRSVSSAAMILEGTDKKDAAWEFVKWWTSTETQTAYSRQLESFLGPQAKWNTANIESYSYLPWKRDDLEVVRSSFDNVVETPAVLGGYFTQRHYDNAWNRLVINSDAKWTVRDSLEQAVEDINKELVKKQQEYKHLLR